MLSFIRKIKRKRYLKRVLPFVLKEKSAVLTDSFTIRLDCSRIGKKYLLVSEGSIVNGHFIFESEEGTVSIGKKCFIGQSTFISRSSIKIGNNVNIAWGSTFYDHDSHSLDYLDRRKDVEMEMNNIKLGRNFVIDKDWERVKTKPIVVCDDAWIGMNCIILKGVTIGEGAVVGAGSVVTKDVPAWTVVAGNPAKVVKTLR